MSTLEEFAALLKNERRTARRTLRELAEAAGKSIGYLSDVEQGRKLPPPAAVVTKIEEELGIRDGRLIKLAEKVRSLRPTELVKMIRNNNPKMTQILMRADGLSEEDLDKLLETVAQMQERRRNQCQN
ncbi:MAG: helix-turn-helix transcriptional regulator [Gemmatimonadota bacterium]|nr:helix-turn-helix transcriptional regulator [Gemmatimonadota bacterium]